MARLVDGRYELLEVIATGGMATVWRARDTRLDRFVAVKRQPHPTTLSTSEWEALSRTERAHPRGEGRPPSTRSSPSPTMTTTEPSLS